MKKKNLPDAPPLIFQMSDAAFKRLSRFIESEVGIRMPEAKKNMLQARLQKRLRKLKFTSFDDYCDFVFSRSQELGERICMIDAVTTNKTEFFREARHFDFLFEKVLPLLMSGWKNGAERLVRIWSAGCSTGEEAYSLAMVCSEFQNLQPGFRFIIVGTDIASDVLNTAYDGIYSHERIEPVPINFRKKYLLKGKKERKEQVRIIPQLRKRTTFKSLNLMDGRYPFSRQFDIVFCRNVLIYFNRSIQERILQQICQHIKEGSWLFTGHSETLNGMNVPLKLSGASVYRRI